MNEWWLLNKIIMFDVFDWCLCWLTSSAGANKFWLVFGALSSAIGFVSPPFSLSLFYFIFWLWFHGLLHSMPGPIITFLKLNTNCMPGQSTQPPNESNKPINIINVCPMRLGYTLHWWLSLHMDSVSSIVLLSFIIFFCCLNYKQI